MNDPRAIALNLLNRCEAAGQYSNLALDTALRRNDFSQADRGFLTALFYGVIEKKLQLDAVIDSLAQKKANGIEPEIRMLLRMGLYQLSYMERVPDHAAVNETVKMAPKRAKGFVNALLRSHLRNEKRIPLPDAGADSVGYLSVLYSVSPALCSLLMGQYGMERTQSILSAFESHPPVTLRIHPSKTNREAFLARLREDGYSAEKTRESRHGIRVSGASVTELPGFDEGFFFVQDEASQLCVEALDVHPGMQVLDTCACPGSKSFGAALDLMGKGRVTSCDLHANKLSLIRTGAERLGISDLIREEERDARIFRSEWEEKFDRVLCDVPCSGFGVLAKKPELRYKNPDQTEALPAIQRAILETSCRYVLPGGKLVYSTCTLLQRENEENVSDFLSRHNEFEMERMRTLFPDSDGTDGFFFAVLVRRTAKIRTEENTPAGRD